eukprot:6198845-Pleurochrysis_carterae.AAC.1
MSRDSFPVYKPCRCFLPILESKRRRLATLEREAVEKGVSVHTDEIDDIDESGEPVQPRTPTERCR